MTTNKCTDEGYDAADFTLNISQATEAVSTNDAALNSCIHKFMESKEYYDLCTKYPTLLDDCYPNSHFPPMGDDQAPYLMPTDELAASNHTCATGYCPCTAQHFKIGTNSYSPYTFQNTNGTWTGFGVEFAHKMSEMCEVIEIEVVETPWYDCWRYDDTGIGEALENRTVDACMTYTHTHGIRNEFADFSSAILKTNKAAGLLGRLDENGKPLVSSDSDLSGLRVVDVGGWAPTPDTLVMTTNKCTDEGYDAADFTLNISQATEAVSTNDAALRMLLDGEADLVYIYSDQPKNIIDQCKKGEQDEKTNCTMWEQFGSAYAFVQTGKFGWVQNGTTLAMTKKGSGVDAALNSCIHKFMESKEYYDLCTKYPTLLDDCYPNSHFPPMGDDQAPYLMPTDDLAASNHTCATGYCPCDAAMSTTVKTGATGTTDLPEKTASSGATSASMSAWASALATK